MSSVGAAPTAPDLPALSVRALRVSSGARALDSARAVLLDVEAMAVSLICSRVVSLLLDIAPSFVSLGLCPAPDHVLACTTLGSAGMSGNPRRLIKKDVAIFPFLIWG